MGVTFYPTNIKAESFHLRSPGYSTSIAQATFEPAAEAMRTELWWEAPKKTVSMSSFAMQAPDDPSIIGVGNGFVETVMTAYNSHRMLIIRPDDVWMAILTQFSFFVNGNAETLRGSFVEHKGQKGLHVNLDDVGFDPEYLVAQFAHLLQENITDPSIREWIVPDFSTTTALDRTVSSIVMMSTFKKYFRYSCDETCGLPSVTLQGTKKDWQSLARRIEKLKEYGPETTAWYSLLHPILRQFVAAFDNPSHPRNLDFWNKVMHSRYYCGGGALSGWITAFCVFSCKGVWAGPAINSPVQVHDVKSVAAINSPVQVHDVKSVAAVKKSVGRALWSKLTGKSKNIPQASGTEENSKHEPLTDIFDASIYPSVDINNIPPACVGCEVECIGTGPAPKIQLLAGSGAFQITSSGDKKHSAQGKFDTIQPVMCWWVYVEE